MVKKELVNISRTGKSRVWRITLNGDSVTTEFGYEGGKFQSVTDYGRWKNRGRTNEVPPDQDAQNLFDRLIKEKIREGYRDASDVFTVENDIYDDILPESLRFYKPQNTLNAHMAKKIASGSAWLVRKYDGEMIVCRKNAQGKCEIYSRRMTRTHNLETIPWEVRYPNIVKAVEECSAIPPNTVLLGELVVDAHEDQRTAVTQISKSKTNRAIQMQEELSYLRFCVWDIAWMAREPLLGNIPYRDRCLKIHSIIASLHVNYPSLADNIFPAEYWEASAFPDGLSSVMDMLRETEWEGFVAVDPDDTYGDRGFNFRGKAERPKGCCKIKTEFEDDFVALWSPEENIGTYGTGKYVGLLGSVVLYQLNTSGELVEICKCGNGWTKKFIEQNSTVDSWPKVLKIKYDTRTYVSAGDKTNALQFPRFIEERFDKTEQECVNIEL